MTWGSSRAIALALLLLPLVALEEPGVALGPALAADDACEPGEGACDLSMRQLRGERGQPLAVAEGGHGAGGHGRSLPGRPVLLETDPTVTVVPISTCIKDFVALPVSYEYVKGPHCPTGPCGFHGTIRQCKCGAGNRTTCDVLRYWELSEAEERGKLTDFQAIQVPVQTFYAVTGWVPNRYDSSKHPAVFKGFRASLKWASAKESEQATTWQIPGYDTYISFVGDSTTWTWNWFN
uniref:Phospholipase B-like n=1 Tax=Alexandrium catenella TaxID=2925 RepID=A0A7S1KWX3_ALECA|mmetsp:Transcript_102021/g.271479  ORF Transcript_102021/g.271479 Transcript_102021/m.271479 type:complete len:236 (+) Transcript_102021:54-761(+)